MANNDLVYLSGRELAAMIKTKKVSPVEVTQAYLDRITLLNPKLNAFITVTKDQAMAQARQAEKDISGGKYLGPLHGLPYAPKDILATKGILTTNGSKVTADWVPNYESTITERLSRSGAILLGKLNLLEFAMGSGVLSGFGPARNPWHTDYSPSGSSSGSGAAVAAYLTPLSIGTDTGGSIRIPSAACGLVGLKPAFGEIPLDGVVPLSRTFDHVGPLCRSVEDAGILHQMLAGVSNPPPLKARDLKGLRLGIPRGYFFAVLDPEIGARFDEACDRLTTAGAILDDVAIPHAADAPTIYLHVALPEAAACHAKTLESQPEDYTANVRLRLEMARYIMGEDYVRAMHGRDVLIREVNAALHGRDGLLLPTLPVPAVTLGAATVSVGTTEEPVRAVTLRLTQPFNITGHPAITMPCGCTQNGLPAGAQLVGMDTLALLSVASAIEKALQLS